MRRRMESMPPPAPSAVQMRFDDYATVDGVKLPKRISLSVDGTPTPTSIAVAIAIHDFISLSLRRRPASAAARPPAGLWRDMRA